MKKSFYAILILFLWLNIYAESTTSTGWGAVNQSSNSIKWEVWTYENVKVLEFILNIKWSALVENLKADKSRLSQWTDWNYNVKNVRRNEEKLAMKLTNFSWQSLIYANFDLPKWSNYNKKQFNKVELINHNGQLKAKVSIYLHPEIDIEASRLFLTNDDKWRDIDNIYYDTLSADVKLKTVAYIYVWLNNKKLWRVINIY